MVQGKSGLMLAFTFMGSLVFLISYGITRKLCSNPSFLAVLDHPNERSLHEKPTPRTGGLAILTSLMIGILLGTLLHQLPSFGGFLWVTAITLTIGAASFWDDQMKLPPLLRLGIHCLCATGLIVGDRLAITTIPFPYLGSLSLGYLSLPFSALFLMWITNLYNFMDGLDGFAGGMAVLGCGVLGLIAWKGGHQAYATILMLIAISTSGFLLHNLPPAKIFMGDVGSVSLGFLIGSLALKGIQAGVFDFWVPIIVFSPFIVDATTTLFRRLMKGEKIWQPHRKHYYQRLVLAGWGHRRTVFTEYLLILATGASALFYRNAGPASQLLLLAVWAAIYASLAFGIRVLESRQPKIQK